MKLSLNPRVLVVAIAAAGLSACTESSIRLNPDFGSAVTQDKAAQIADPDPHWVGVPAPGSNGARVAGAVRRYETGRVIQPGGSSASGNAAGYSNNNNGENAAATGDVGSGGSNTGTTLAPN